MPFLANDLECSGWFLVNTAMFPKLSPIQIPYRAFANHGFFIWLELPSTNIVRCPRSNLQQFLIYLLYICTVVRNYDPVFYNKLQSHVTYWTIGPFVLTSNAYYYYLPGLCVWVIAYTKQILSKIRTNMSTLKILLL